MSVPKADVLLAYRHIYTQSLRAVQYSKPARYTVRDRLRRIFRTNSTASFDQLKIDNTVEFLRGAARERGLEHRIVKNLLQVWAHENYWRTTDRYIVGSKTQSKDRDKEEIRVTRTAYDPFYNTIRMLNESVGMCIQ